MKLNKINVKKYLFLVLLLWLSTLYLFAGDFISFQFFGLDCQCSEPAFYEVGSICILFFILLGLLLPYAEIKKAHNSSNDFEIIYLFKSKENKSFHFTAILYIIQLNITLFFSTYWYLGDRCYHNLFVIFFNILGIGLITMHQVILVDRRS